MKMKVVDKGSADSKEGEFRASGSNTRLPGGRREIIKKYPVKANLEDYDAAYASFSWDDAKKEISWFANGKMNAAFNAVDRHMNNGRRNKVALYSVDAQNQLEAFTFQDLYYLSNRLGNALKNLGVVKGDRVFIFMPRVP
ncbi:MAG: AMP-binding protein, partial [Candidatus Obscuribacterales bacterium]|nr:AMP-binding protein [Candidatus Obscuribacterales bacterium]